MSIVNEAKELVHGDRQIDYGDVAESFDRIAAFWSAYTGVRINALDVAKMMILLKVSRAKYNNHHDSYVDIVGYVECVDHLLAREHAITK